MPNKINNAHDKFVRETFSNVEHVTAFFERFLPEEIRTQLDFTSLKISRESYIQKDLSEYLSDIVFEIRTLEEKPLDLVLLLEHKSSSYKYTLIQVGHYLFSHWIKCLEKNKPLKPIIPIIYYQGKRKWKAPSVKDLFAGVTAPLSDYLPVLNHIFIALNSLSDDDILTLKINSLAAALFAQKGRFDQTEPLLELKRIFNLLSNSEVDRNFILMIGVYIISVSKIQPPIIIEAMENMSSEIKEEVMTTYEQLIEQGRIEGREEGIEEGIEKGIEEGEKKGKSQVILNGYNNGLDIAMLSNITQLTQEEVVQILREQERILL